MYHCQPFLAVKRQFCLGIIADVCINNANCRTFLRACTAVWRRGNGKNQRLVVNSDFSCSAVRNFIPFQLTGYRDNDSHFRMSHQVSFRNGYFSGFHYFALFFWFIHGRRICLLCIVFKRNFCFQFRRCSHIVQRKGCIKIHILVSLCQRVKYNFGINHVTKSILIVTLDKLERKDFWLSSLKAVTGKSSREIFYKDGSVAIIADGSALDRDAKPVFRRSQFPFIISLQLCSRTFFFRQKKQFFFGVGCQVFALVLQKIIIALFFKRKDQSAISKRQRSILFLCGDGSCKRCCRTVYGVCLPANNACPAFIINGIRFSYFWQCNQIRLCSHMSAIVCYAGGVEKIKDIDVGHAVFDRICTETAAWIVLQIYICAARFCSVVHDSISIQLLIPLNDPIASVGLRIHCLFGTIQQSCIIACIQA